MSSNLASTLIPKSLDDIIRLHKDEASIYLSTSDQIQGLTRAIVDINERDVKDTVENWRLISLDSKGKVAVLLLGDGRESRHPWITSPLQAVDLGAGLVVTTNSVYALGTPGEGEPDTDHLIRICAFLAPGAQQYFGIPAFFY